MIVEAFGLRGIQPGLGNARFHRKRNAGSQPTAGCCHRDNVGQETLRRQIFDDLAPCRPLSGDDQRIVIGRHQRGVAFLGDLAGDGRSVFPCAVVEHYFRAQRRGALTLGAGRVGWHNNDGRHAKKLRSRRDALGMISRRKGHHATRTLILRNGGELVVGAAELERAGALQRLGLEKHARAGERIKHWRRQ
jgi:hypothetical protein